MTTCESDQYILVGQLDMLSSICCIEFNILKLCTNTYSHTMTRLNEYPYLYFGRHHRAEF